MTPKFSLCNWKNSYLFLLFGPLLPLDTLAVATAVLWSCSRQITPEEFYSGKECFSIVQILCSCECTARKGKFERSVFHLFPSLWYFLFCYSGSSDRLARLTKHLLSQRSFYPSSPPAEDVHVDYPHYEHYAMLPVFPHVLVTPSDLRYFLKDVNHCCCVNPGRLAKGQIGGSFAKLMVHPAMGNETKPVIERISAQIVRIWC